MRQILMTTTLVAAGTLAAAAQDVRDCGEIATAEAIAEPWAENTATYANDRVRLAIIDTLEPAAAAFHLMILSPPYDEVGGRQCKLIGLEGGLGFAGLSLEGITSSYDPAKGLTWNLTANLFEQASGGFKPTPLEVTINQNTGVISARLK